MRRHQEADRAVTRSDSFKLAHVIDQRLAKGGSCQGFGPEAKQALKPTALQSMPDEADPAKVSYCLQF